MTILGKVLISSKAIDRQLYYLPAKNQFQLATSVASIQIDRRITYRELTVACGAGRDRPIATSTSAVGALPQIDRCQSRC